jgi:hypothetical protein
LIRLRAHRPPHDATRIQIEQHGQIQPAGSCGDRGQISGPDSIRRGLKCRRNNLAFVLTAYPVNSLLEAPHPRACTTQGDREAAFIGTVDARAEHVVRHND